MDIKEAKLEIINTVKAYLSKNSEGEYIIPRVHQRPILLMGPPGIGKTQIMEQVAKECGIALVSYTITHHTRQSAVGLPFIVKKDYMGKEYSVTEYTMSEIIAAVYDKIESSGLKEGILFIDEINCVSETLAPAILELLQFKRFGNTDIPNGWVLATAGNPPEYNKSVRELDIVTLDRVKRIDVRENFPVWKEYAYKKGIHPAIISYLDLRRNNFYRIEESVDGTEFATARGWEDLSQTMSIYEQMGVQISDSIVYQFIQHRKIAVDFANYYELYIRYEKEYPIDEVLAGRFENYNLKKLSGAPFDERLSVVSILVSKLANRAKAVLFKNNTITEIFDILKEIKSSESGEISKLLFAQMNSLREEYGSEGITPERAEVLKATAKKLKEYIENSKHSESFDTLKNLFDADTALLDNDIDELSKSLEYAFDFMELIFGASQEMTVFVTELSINIYTLRFIEEFGCEKFYRYNKILLVDGETL